MHRGGRVTQYKHFTKSVVIQIVVTMVALTAIINNAAAEENQELAVAFQTVIVAIPYLAHSISSGHLNVSFVCNL